MSIRNCMAVFHNANKSKDNKKPNPLSKIDVLARYDALVAEGVAEIIAARTVINELELELLNDNLAFKTNYGLSNKDVIKTHEDLLDSINTNNKNTLSSIQDISTNITNLSKQIDDTIENSNNKKVTRNRLVITRDDSNEKKKTINKIIDIHHKVLKDTDKVLQEQVNSALSYGMFKDEYTPKDSKTKALYESIFGKDTKNNKIPEFVQALVGDSFDVTQYPLSDLYQLDFYDKGGIGKLGVAIFSTASMFNAYIQSDKFNVTLSHTVTVKNKTTDKPYEIKLGGTKFDGTTFSQPATLSNPQLYKSKVIEWYQSTSVDNAKLNKLAMLNINKYTTDVINIMNQMGFDEEVIWFINQPIIRDYINQLKVYSSSMSEVGSFKAKRAAQNYVRAKYMNEAINKKIGKNNTTTDVFTKFRDSIHNMVENITYYKNNKDIIDNLEIPRREEVADEASNTNEDITQNLDDANVQPGAPVDPDAELSTEELTQFELNPELYNFLGEQLAILNEYIRMEGLGSKMKQIAIAYNIDSKGIGKDVDENVIKIHRINHVVSDLSKTFVNIEKVLGKVVPNRTDKSVEVGTTNNTIHIEPSGIIGGAILNGMYLARNLYGDMFPQYSKAYSEFIEKIMAESKTKNDEFSIDTIMSALSRGIKRHAYSYAIGQHVDVDAEFKRLLLENRTIEGFGASLASIIQRFVDENALGKNNALLTSLRLKPANRNELATIGFNNVSDNADLTAVYQGMYDLLKTDILIYKDANDIAYTSKHLVRDLTLYAYITGGVQSFNEFVKLIPTSYKNELNLPGHLSDYFQDIPNMLATNEEFYRQFMQHNPTLAYSLNSNSNGKGRTYQFKTKHDGAFIDANTVLASTHMLLNPEHVNYNGAVVHTKQGDEKIMPKYVTYSTGNNNYLFELIGPSTVVGEYEYVRIHTLGKGNISEYNANYYEKEAKSSARFSPVGVERSDEFFIEPDDNNLLGKVFAHENHYIVLNSVAANTRNRFHAMIARHFIRTKFYADYQIMSTKEFIDKHLSNFKNIAHKQDYAKIVKALPNITGLVFNSYPEFGKFFLYNEDTLKKELTYGSDYVYSTILHEYGHMLFSDTLEKGKIDVGKNRYTIAGNFYNTMEALRKEAENHVRSIYGDTFVNELINAKNDNETLSSEQYKFQGIANVHEFVSEMIGSEDFVGFFGNVYSNTDINTNSSTLFQKFMDAILNLLRKMGLRVNKDSISHKAISKIFHTQYSITNTQFTKTSVLDTVSIKDPMTPYDYRSYLKYKDPSMTKKDLKTLSNKYYDDYNANIKNLEEAEYADIHKEAIDYIGGSLKAYHESLAISNKQSLISELKHTLEIADKPKYSNKFTDENKAIVAMFKDLLSKSTIYNIPYTRAQLEALRDMIFSNKKGSYDTLQRMLKSNPTSESTKSDKVVAKNQDDINNFFASSAVEENTEDTRRAELTNTDLNDAEMELLNKLVEDNRISFTCKL